MKRIFIHIVLLLLMFITPIHAADPRFIDKADGTIYDAATNLIWLKNANCFSEQTWSVAITQSNSLANGQCGLTDGTIAGNWHLPSIRLCPQLVDI